MSVFLSKSADEISARIAKLRNEIEANQEELSKAQEELSAALIDSDGSKQLERVTSLKLKADALPRSLEILERELSTAVAREKSKSFQQFLSQIPKHRKEVESIAEALVKSVDSATEQIRKLYTTTEAISEDLVRRGLDSKIVPVTFIPSLSDAVSNRVTVDSYRDNLTQTIDSQFEVYERRAKQEADKV